MGLGNAALSPLVTKTLIDTYLKPLLVGGRSVGYRVSVAADVPPHHGIRAQGRGDDRDLAQWTSRSGICSAKTQSSRYIRLLGGRTKEAIPVYASRLYAMPIDELRAEAQKYKDQGYTAMKLRFGWGPIDGARGNAEERRTGAQRARSDRRRHRPDGGRLHGLDAGLRQAHAAAARTVPSALAGRAGDSRRHARLQGTEEPRTRSDRGRRA